jgi:hypothetical protein
MHAKATCPLFTGNCTHFPFLKQIQQLVTNAQDPEKLGHEAPTPPPEVGVERKIYLIGKM